MSGLTTAASLIATGLHALGHSVTVLTSRNRPELPMREVLDGVQVHRVNVAGHVSKGVLMPGYIATAGKLSREHDLVITFLPAGPAECIAAILASRGRPLVVEYICDIRLPGGIFDRAVEWILGLFHKQVAKGASAIVVSSQDYAGTSKFLQNYKEKVRIAPLPVRISQPRDTEVLRLRAYASGGGPLVGMAARLAADKGFELLLEALPRIQRRIPEARVICAGDFQTVVGEDSYHERILPRIESLGSQWRMLGVLKPDLASFFAACDVLILPSVNRTESFGLVQAEAMLCGTPVVASDLPGIRVPVESTGMGRLFRPGDPQDLADAVVTVLERRPEFIKPLSEIEKIFSEETALRCRLDILSELAK